MKKTIRGFKVKHIKNQQTTTHMSGGIEVTVNAKINVIGRFGLLLMKAGAFLIYRFGIDAKIV